MAQGEDRIVLAIECGHCSQITGVQIYNGALRIVRCGMCGQIFHAADALVRQYQAYADHLARSEGLGRALQEAQEAMQFALEPGDARQVKSSCRGRSAQDMSSIHRLGRQGDEERRDRYGSAFVSPR